MTDSARVLARIDAGRAARARELADAMPAPVTAAARMGASFLDGARVFDPVTGIEGVVYGSVRQNLVVSAARE